MPLVVPILRLFMLFLNVFETFKTMKPPSRRRGGQPSVRAITQRKRDMKGCLAVWVVWCCFATYERLFESFFCFLVPFYSEIKSMVLIFLLVTRAKGAEPIYLHLIRPLIKPYASTVDSLLDLARMFGDIFFFLFSSLPLRHALSWWNGALQDGDDVQETEGSHPEPSLYGILPDLDTDGRAGSGAYPAIVPNSSGLTQTTLVEEQLPISRENSIDEGTGKQGASFEKSNSKADQASTRVRTRRQGLQTGAATFPPSVPPIVRSDRRSDGNNRNDERNTSLRSSLDGPKPHEPQLYRWQLNDPNAKAVPAYEIWRPSPSAYEESVGHQNAQHNRSDARRPSHSRSHSSNSDLTESTPPPAEPSHSELPEVDEWRLYAPFPSAYPPTPLPGPVKLPPVKSNIAATSRRSSDKIQFPPITEEENESSAQSLQPPRGPPNPGSDGTLSDDDKISTTGHDSNSDGESMDVDSDGDEEDDDFDITLQTPRRQRLATLSARRPQLNAMASSSSIASSSESAALSTVGGGMTLRTRSSSGSSSSTDTDSSATPSYKISIPQVGLSGAQNTTRATNKSYATRSSKSDEVSLRIVSETVRIPRTQQVNPSASEPNGEDMSGPDKGGKDSGAGKRRVALPPKVASGSSTSLPPAVPEKDDTATRRAAVNGSATSTRGKARGRGLAPSRSSTRLANSRPLPASANSSQSTLTDTQATHAIPSNRDRTIRNRR